MANQDQKFEANSWEFTQKMIRIGHNRRVKRHFKDVQSDTATNTGRAAIKTSLLIRDADSGIECLNKMIYFSNYLSDRSAVSYADGWQVKKGQDISQLAIIYRATDKDNKSGNYTIHIPHYNGGRSFRPPSYTKGSIQARWILKDNSHIVVNAATEAEAKRVIRKLEKTVDKQFRTSESQWLKIGTVGKGTYKKVKVAPIYADYYSKGKENNYADWRVFM